MVEAEPHKRKTLTARAKTALEEGAEPPHLHDFRTLSRTVALSDHATTKSDTDTHTQVLFKDHAIMACKLVLFIPSILLHNVEESPKAGHALPSQSTTSNATIPLAITTARILETTSYDSYMVLRPCKGILRPSRNLLLPFARTIDSVSSSALYLHSSLSILKCAGRPSTRFIYRC